MWKIIEATHHPGLFGTNKVLNWLTDIGTHIQECIEIILSNGSIPTLAMFLGESQYLPQVIEQNTTNQNYSLLVKTRVIELDKVEKFVKYYSEHISSYRNENYSLEQFYSDLPTELKLEITL